MNEFFNAIIKNAMLLTNVFTIVVCFKNPQRTRKKLILSLLGMAAMILVAVKSVEMGYYVGATGVNLDVFAFFIPFYFLTRGSFSCRFYLYFSQLAIMCFLGVFAGFVAEIFTEYLSDNYFWLTIAITLALYASTAVLAWRYGKNFFDMLFAKTDNTRWIIYAILPTASFFSINALCFRYNNVIPIEILAQPHIFIMCFFSMVGFLLLPYSIISSYNKTAALYELKLAKSLLKSGQDYYHKIEELSGKINILRHDINYHFTVIRNLLDRADTDSVRAYLDKLDSAYAAASVKKYSKSHVINALLDNFSERCDKAQIKFSPQIHLPSNIGLDDYELCVILGNLLENAIYACQLVHEEKERYINLIIKPHEDQFGIMVENSFDGQIMKKSDGLLSLKPDGGLGISSIKSIAEHRGGNYYSTWDEKNFNAYVVINTHEI